MDLHLAGKHVLITGGSKGIGLACAQGFLLEGAMVSLVARDKANLQLVQQALGNTLPGASGRVAVFAANLSDPAEALRALNEAEQAGAAVDILINSAGAAHRTAPDDLTPEAWHNAMHAKYFSYIHVMDPAVKRMAQRGHGVIVNVIGMGGKVASPIHLPGGAANAALMLASAGLAAAYAAKGVRINAVNPGLTLTERLKEGLLAEAKLNNISADEALRRATERSPLGRIAEPHEIADAVMFLASDRASYITGAILAMDGAATPLI